MDDVNENNLELSVILPCRNEEASLEFCILKIQDIFRMHNINGEIIISDSSIDSSPEIARKHQVKLIKHDKEGYGIAYLEGFKQAQGNYIFMADADGTYDFAEIPNFLNYLKQGHDFVIGDRFKGKMDQDAMPWLHRYIGNPVLSGLFRIFFRSQIRDVHCGMRAITKPALEGLNLKTTGMEFASEMIIKAHNKKLKIKELPVNYYKRKGESKLRSFADGWRHLRFMLLYSPLFLFFIPGLLFFSIGLFLIIVLYFDLVNILGIKLFYHPMFLAASLIVIGYQLIIFALFTKSYAVIHLDEQSKFMDRIYKIVTIEKASTFGLIVSLAGIIIYSVIFFTWVRSGFGALEEIKNSIVALVLIILGIQTIFSSFMLSIIGIKER